MKKAHNKNTNKQKLIESRTLWCVFSKKDKFENLLIHKYNSCNINLKNIEN